MTRWAILTGEYPPQYGGVSDYTRLIATGLAAAGDTVTVYAPPVRTESSDLRETCDAGVSVVRLPDHFGPRGLITLDRSLRSGRRPNRILLQYVPHAYGFKAMNLPFAAWIRRRAWRLAPVWVMFHEVAFPWEHGQSVKHQILGSVTALMAKWIAGAAERIFVSIPGWQLRLQRVARVNERIFWLPIPSTLPTPSSPVIAEHLRERLHIPFDAPLIGHFGTYGESITQMLTPLLGELLRRQPTCHCLLMGRTGDRYAETFHGQDSRIHATGSLPAADLSECLLACDVLLQPYPDGISCRRTSAMAALALGRPLVSNTGALSEPLWQDGGAVALGPVERPVEFVSLVEELLADQRRREELGERARRLYQERFSLEQTIDVLLGKRDAMPFPAETQ